MCSQNVEILPSHNKSLSIMMGFLFFTSSIQVLGMWVSISLLVVMFLTEHSPANCEKQHISLFKGMLGAAYATLFLDCVFQILGIVV